MWYQRARMAPALGEARPQAQEPFVACGGRWPARRAGASSDSTELLTSLGLIQPPGASQYGVPMSSSHSGPTVIS